ncbi:DUF2306 domain-containing protein [Lentibacillus juripiscarius]|uniref:DUF2306 domain-containing protein n=2 Tax=Lentibacillus juripiscarius TaxID=257446 RepID=A0ABW5V4W5_9BACI
MTARKRRGRHTFCGELYHGSYVIVFVSSIAMAVLHWEESAYLFYIALFSYGLAFIGYLAAKKRWINWLSFHLSGMAGSYIGIITAVLVVNVSKIPVLNALPELWYWFLPTIIGTPLIMMSGRRYTAKVR